MESSLLLENNPVRRIIIGRDSFALDYESGSGDLPPNEDEDDGGSDKRFIYLVYEDITLETDETETPPTPFACPKFAHIKIEIISNELDFTLREFLLTTIVHNSYLLDQYSQSVEGEYAGYDIDGLLRLQHKNESEGRLDEWEKIGKELDARLHGYSSYREELNAIRTAFSASRPLLIIKRDDLYAQGDSPVEAVDLCELVESVNPRQALGGRNVSLSSKLFELDAKKDYDPNEKCRYTWIILNATDYQIPGLEEFYQKL